MKLFGKSKSKEFSKPDGTAFVFEEELRATELSRVLVKVVNFLHAEDPSVELHRYDDWWQHDGLHFHRDQIDFDYLYSFVRSAKSLLESTPDDHEVFVGVAPADSSWYLRYRVEWDDSGSEPIGGCTLIFPVSLIDKLRWDVLSAIDLKPAEIDSGAYYAEVIELL